MLFRLSVSNFAIIDNLQLNFNRGLSIITGETGAGKSILLGALKLLLGERAELKQLKDPSKKSILEAEFDLTSLDLQTFFSENELDFENQTIIRRELLPSGKSRAFINDTPVTLDILRQLSEQLIDIHSQFNSEHLTHETFQIQILDAYALQLDQVKAYQFLLLKRRNLVTDLAQLQTKKEELNKESDYHHFLLEELQKSQIKEEELDELEQAQSELQNVDEIQQILSETLIKLEDSEIGITNQLQDTTSKIQRISNYGKDLESLAERFQSLHIELKDLQHEIKFQLDRVEANPKKLNEINERINLIHTLLNKHKVQKLVDLIKIQSEFEKENSDSDQLDQSMLLIENEIKKVEIDLKKLAEKLSANRNSIIKKVEKEILQNLQRLGMENSILKIKLHTGTNFLENGTDKIEFLFSANKGGNLLPIGKAVSGGERSRLMLIIKKILAGKLQLPTLILDEIDTGVSGKVADEVGNLMKEMAEDLQLIAITHLPQVAAKAKEHFKVSKKTKNDQTTTDVRKLTETERINEIATLLSGSTITESAIQQAEQLIGK